MNKLFILNEYAPQSRGVEIGVWKGEFSKAIVDKVNPSALYLCDPWRFFPQYSDRWYGGTLARSQADMDVIYREVVDMFKENPSVRVVRDFSDNLFGYIEKNSLDWTYIDGNHSYEFVLRDLEISRDLIKPGGMITGDDYEEGNDIERAVSDFIFKYSGNIDSGYIRDRQFIIKFKP